MQCPGCGNETASTVMVCMKCGWQSPELDAPPEPVRRPFDLRYVTGTLLILAGLGLTAASYVLQRDAGRAEYAVFYGLVLAGILSLHRARRGAG